MVVIAMTTPQELEQKLERLAELLDKDWKQPRDRYEYFNAADDIETLYMGLLDLIAYVREILSYSTEKT